MSDSVADSGRGTSRVAPSLVGGPEKCDGSSQFVIRVSAFCRVVIFRDLLISEYFFGRPW